MLEPTPYKTPQPPQPAGNWLTRGFNALFVERRLPYRIAVWLDTLCNAVGLRFKTVSADGFTLRVRRSTCDEKFVSNIIVNHEYTPTGFDIGEADVVIDIGANIGMFSLLAARYAANGKVFAFEPNFENYRLLESNIELNQSTNVIAKRAAVSGENGQVKLYCSSQGGFHSVLEDRMTDSEQFEIVDAVSLANIFEEHKIERCNFLKLDCEGAEYEILYNLPREYFERIDKIVMEYHGDKNYDKRRAQSDALVCHLQQMGFFIEDYLEFTEFCGGFIRAKRVPCDTHSPRSLSSNNINPIGHTSNECPIAI